MNKFDSLLADSAIGSSFYVSPHILGMDGEGFHKLVEAWVAAGGGDGFTVSDAGKESASGGHQYVIVKITRTE